MIEAMAVMGIVQCLLSLVNVVNCLWEHDTKTLLPWILSGLGWFVVSLQMLKRIVDGETK